MADWAVRSRVDRINPRPNRRINEATRQRIRMLNVTPTDSRAYRFLGTIVRVWRGLPDFAILSADFPAWGAPVAFTILVFYHIRSPTSFTSPIFRFTARAGVPFYPFLPPAGFNVLPCLQFAPLPVGHFSHFSAPKGVTDFIASTASRHPAQQPANQQINRPTDQAINQSPNQRIGRPINQSSRKLRREAIFRHALNQAARQCANKWTA